LFKKAADINTQTLPLLVRLLLPEVVYSSRTTETLLRGCALPLLCSSDMSSGWEILMQLCTSVPLVADGSHTELVRVIATGVTATLAHHASSSRADNEWVRDAARELIRPPTCAPDSPTVWSEVVRRVLDGWPRALQAVTLRQLAGLPDHSM